MKHVIFGAAAAVASISAAFIPSSAFARSQVSTAQGGHYEWQAQPTYGPRASLKAPQRVWVADKATAADKSPGGNRDCPMMNGMGMGQGMMNMHKPEAPSGGTPKS